MGNFRLEETHLQNLSSIAWRAIVAGFIVLCCFTLFLVLMNTAQIKHISVIQNGEERILETKQITLQDFFEEQGITVGEHDQVSMKLDTEIKNGDSVIIFNAIPIKLTADGRSRTLYTTAKTVFGVLHDFHVSLGFEDQITPDLSAEIQQGEAIRIVRVETRVEEIEEIIPYEVIHRDDNKLVKGKMRIDQMGRDGLIRTKIQKRMEDGVVVSEEVIEEIMESEVSNELVAIGSMNPVIILSANSPDVQKVNKEGVTFGVKQVLNNVTLTAYDAGLNSTGKEEGHPQYGITFTGTTVEQGRTVAVDPKVIPLGWWIYIEGVGLRRAEDIGSAIKGKKVDVYMDSEDQANIFGRKRGNTVYIIGPQKPEIK